MFGRCLHWSTASKDCRAAEEIHTSHGMQAPMIPVSDSSATPSHSVITRTMHHVDRFNTQLENLHSPIDMHTHAGRAYDNHVTLIFWFKVNACRATAMYLYVLCWQLKLCFHSTHTCTRTVTDATDNPTHASATSAGVANKQTPAQNTTTTGSRINSSYSLPCVIRVYKHTHYRLSCNLFT